MKRKLAGRRDWASLIVAVGEGEEGVSVVGVREGDDEDVGL